MGYIGGVEDSIAEGENDSCHHDLDLAQLAKATVEGLVLLEKEQPMFGNLSGAQGLEIALMTTYPCKGKK
jgi:hypothetical protein